MSAFEIGDRVRYSGTYGLQFPVATKIVGVGEENDQQVYDVEGGKWGYADQIETRETADV